MSRKRHTTAQWVATTLALALAAAILFAIFVPMIAVPVAVMLEPVFSELDDSRGRAGITFFFGLFWMGVWIAMSLVPGAGFALVGWMPFWTMGSKKMRLRKWWIAMILGAAAGLTAVLVFLFVEGFASLPGGGGKWSAAAVIGAAAGGSLVGSLLFLLTLKLMPRVREEQWIAPMGPVVSKAQQPVMVEKVEKPAVAKPGVNKPKKEKKDENLKWTDWGKTWKPPGDEERRDG